ncbi:MAG TPA: hypothetical protein PKK56_00655 [archaeon]|jgi:hypothetical protein|nr:hypothetical protein [archaeon]HPC10339.1 hypothetical protein [archaeon]HRT03900.1 hypothetical protein [Candidatus Diapherotrites archaeon]
MLDLEEIILSLEKLEKKEKSLLNKILYENAINNLREIKEKNKQL